MPLLTMFTSIAFDIFKADIHQLKPVERLYLHTRYLDFNENHEELLQHLVRLQELSATFCNDPDLTLITKLTEARAAILTETITNSQLFELAQLTRHSDSVWQDEARETIIKGQQALQSRENN